MTRELSVTLTALSPVSMGDFWRQGDRLGVRMTSIRGVLRRWYRWYLLSRPNTGPREVKEGEKALFGGGGRSPRASAILLRGRAVQGGAIELSGRDPFLWMLMRRRRRFYLPLKFELVATPRLPNLWEDSAREFARALSLAVTFGGFGFRSSRCYGSFALSGYDFDGEGSKFLELAERASRATSPEGWIRAAEDLLEAAGVKRVGLESRSGDLPRAQDLSHSLMVTLRSESPSYGGDSWRPYLRSAEEALRSAERRLKLAHRDFKVYRALLGMPVSWRDRRPPWAKKRRASPLHLGLAGQPSLVRGILFLSRDYPSELIENIRGRGGTLSLEDFQPVLDSLEEAGFSVR